MSTSPVALVAALSPAAQRLLSTALTHYYDRRLHALRRDVRPVGPGRRGGQARDLYGVESLPVLARRPRTIAEWSMLVELSRTSGVDAD